MMLSLAERFEAKWEAWYPTLLGLSAAALSYWKGHLAFAHMVKSAWAYESLYSAAFGVASVTVPFLFTFYTIFVTTENGFIARMRRTQAYAGTVHSVIVAMIYGATLILASIPMMVVQPIAVEGLQGANVAVALWIGLTVLTFAAFVRAVHQFVIFIDAQHARRG